MKGMETPPDERQEEKQVEARKVDQATQQEAERKISAASQQRLAQPKAIRKASERKRRSPRFKAMAFDKDAVRLVQDGTRSLQRISALLGVDAAETRRRFLEMEKRGLIVFDANAPDCVGLSIEGYNFFRLSPAKQRQAEERLHEERAKPVQPQPSNGVGGNQLQTTPQQPNQSRPENLAVNNVERPESPLPVELDLHELLKRGAPRQGIFVRKQAPEQGVVIEEKRLDARTTELLKKTLEDYEGEKCELCRGEFKLALEGGHPKHGHCFCGAAYHRDCYESLSDSRGSCPRCGRSLEIILDRQSQEAVKAIKSLFE